MVESFIAGLLLRNDVGMFKNYPFYVFAELMFPSIVFHCFYVFCILIKIYYLSNYFFMHIYMYILRPI